MGIAIGFCYVHYLVDELFCFFSREVKQEQSPTCYAFLAPDQADRKLLYFSPLGEHVTCQSITLPPLPLLLIVLPNAAATVIVIIILQRQLMYRNVYHHP